MMSRAPAFLRRSQEQQPEDETIEVLGAAIEREIKQIRQAQTELPPREPMPPRMPLPDYVTPREHVPETGRLSAHAVAAEFERTAVEINSMGVELQRAAQRCEEALAQIHNIITYVGETAEQYRTEAKRMFDQIESASITAEEVRRQCDQMRRMIVNPPPAPPKVTSIVIEQAPVKPEPPAEESTFGQE